MFQISVAGLIVEVNHRYPIIKSEYDGYIVAEEAEADFAVSPTEEDIQAKLTEGVYFTPAQCESNVIYQTVALRLPQFDGFLIHGAAIAVDGEGYIFLAQGGVGKTTHMCLWKDVFGDRAQIINGDKPILRRIDGTWYVCGTPWRGKEVMGTNTMAPLKALCFIERGQENAIAPMTEEEVIRRLFHQVLMPDNEAQVTAFFALLDNVLKTIPCYRLRCNRDPEAAQIAYQGMQHT